MAAEVHFTCRIPKRYSTPFKNYALIQGLAAQAAMRITALDPPEGKEHMTVTFHIVGNNLMMVERARSRISSRAHALGALGSGG